MEAAVRRVTFSTGWWIQLQTSRPRRLSVCDTVGTVIIIVARMIFGVVYFKDCPQQPNIPIYLLVLALIQLIITPYMTFPFERHIARPYQWLTEVISCLLSLAELFRFLWNLAGCVWVFSIYQPNYDPAAANGLYCNKTLHTFAFWTVVWELFSLFVTLALLCIGLLYCMVVTPVLTQREFYGNV